MSTIDLNKINFNGSSRDGTSDYSELENKPQINSTELSGDKSASDLGLASAAQLTTLEQEVGDLDDLETEAHDNLVDAINEAYNHGGETVNVVDNLNSDSSTDALSAKQGKALNTALAALHTEIEGVIGAQTNFVGIVASTSDLPTVTTPSWGLVGTDIDALNAYVWNGTAWTQFGTKTYDFTDYTEINSTVDRLLRGTGNYVYGCDLMRRNVSVDSIGTLAYLQSFCKYDGKYYSTDGSHIAEQSSNFSVLRNVSINLGHGNSLQLVSGGKAWASGWDDNTMYKVNLSTLTVDDTVTLPTTGYTTAAVDEANGLMYIFQRASYPDTIAPYNFIVYDYVNEEIKSTRVIESFGALQSVDYYQGKILMLYGLGTSGCPSGMRIYNSLGDVMAEYVLSIFEAKEPEGIMYDRTGRVILVSDVDKIIYRVLPIEVTLQPEMIDLLSGAIWQRSGIGINSSARLVFEPTTTRIATKIELPTEYIGKTFVLHVNSGYRFVRYMDHEGKNWITGDPWKTADEALLITATDPILWVAVSHADNSDIQLSEKYNLSAIIAFCPQ